MLAFGGEFCCGFVFVGCGGDFVLVVVDFDVACCRGAVCGWFSISVLGLGVCLLV